MPRQKPEFINFVRTEYQYANGTFIKGLLEHIDAIEHELKISKEDEQEAVRKYGEAEQKNDRLAGNVVKLTSEVRQYRAEIERLRALVDEKAKDERRMFEECEKLRAAWLELEKQVPKKVVLPKEVAERMEHWLSQGCDKSGLLFDFYHSPTEKRLVDRYGIEPETIAEALYYGYTVEQTKEERLREGVVELYQKWMEEPVEEGMTYDESLLKALHGIADYTIKFNAEN